MQIFLLMTINHFTGGELVAADLLLLVFHLSLLRLNLPLSSCSTMLIMNYIDTFKDNNVLLIIDLHESLCICTDLPQSILGFYAQALLQSINKCFNGGMVATCDS